MRRKIFQYLFLFALLIALFFYVNGTNQTELYNTKLGQLVAKTEKLNDSIAQLKVAFQNKAYFSLAGNHDAQAYHLGLSYDTIEKPEFRRMGAAPTCSIAAYKTPILVRALVKDFYVDGVTKHFEKQ